MIAQAHPRRARAKRDISLPVLTKEMRSRMRGLRMPALLFLATTLVVAVGLFVLYANFAEGFGDHEVYGSEIAETGKTLFLVLLILEAALCMLLAPALTSGAITQERERQTLDMLLLTRLSAMNIILGKFLSSLGFLALLLFCALPVAALAFLFGGVDPGIVVWALLLLLSVIALFGAIGLLCSVKCPRIASVGVLSYGACIIWLGFVLALLGLCVIGLEHPPEAASSQAHHLAFAAFAAGASLAAAFPVTALITVVLSVIIRRPLPRLFNVLCWLALATAAALLLHAFPEEIRMALYNNSEFVLLGNPLAALWVLISELVDDSPFVSQSGLFVAVTVAIHLLATWVFLVLAAGALQRMRGEDRR